MNESKRVVWIDYLECLAMLFVVIYHTTLYSWDVVATNNTITHLRYFARGLLSTCVPLFFFASGYLLLKHPFNLKAHIKKSIWYVSLVVAWSLITLCINIAISGERPSATSFFWQFIKLRDGWTNHLWYMGALICVFVVFPLIKTTYDNNKKNFIYFTIICFLFTFGNEFMNNFHTIAYHIMGSNKTFDIQNFMNMFDPFRGIFGYSFVYFCIGGLADDILKWLGKFSKKKVNALACVLILISCSLLYGLGLIYTGSANETWDTVWNGYDNILTLVNVLCVFVILTNIKTPNKTVETISKNTLGIFFVHKIVINAISPYIVKVPALCTYAFTVVVAVGVMFVSMGVAYIIKKIPVVKYLLVQPKK